MHDRYDISPPSFPEIQHNPVRGGLTKRGVAKHGMPSERPTKYGLSLADDAAIARILRPFCQKPSSPISEHSHRVSLITQKAEVCGLTKWFH